MDKELCRGGRDARSLAWIVACVAAGLVLAVVLALSAVGPARATDGDATGQEGSALERDVKEADAATAEDGDASTSSGTQPSDDASGSSDEDTGAPAILNAPRRAPARDDWHDANGLPNYGLRIVLDPASGEYVSESDVHAVAFDIRVRAKSGSASDSVVLEHWHKSESGTYELLAEQHLKVTADGWGNKDGQSTAWFWNYGFDFPRKGPGNWQNLFSAYDFDNKATDWQRLAFVMHHWGPYGVARQGGFDTTGDVWVLRAADTSAGAKEAGRSSEAYEYEIESILWSDQKLSYGVSDSAADPKTISSWTPVAEGGYDSFTGVRDLPTSGVETLDITARAKTQEETQSFVSHDEYPVRSRTSTRPAP